MRLRERFLKSGLKGFHDYEVHNHPGGVAEPSDNDDKITEQINNALKTVNISLQDHLIISGNEYFSYRPTGYLE